MHIPTSWEKTSSEFDTPDGRRFHVVVWGWGPDRSAARWEASGRLQRLIERIRRGEPFPSPYTYGSRPLREQIIQTVDGEGQTAQAVITRNRYGALVLNTARLLFLDIDLPPRTLISHLRHLLRGKRVDSATTLLGKLRNTLGEARPTTTFRLYRTAAGFRAIAIDREFEPGNHATETLMQLTGTDSAYVQLCRAQQSFRARLTPKPWRCGCPLPPGEHPRETPELERQFAAWLGAYEAASSRFATCHYLETIGSGSSSPHAADLVQIHDRLTRCHERSLLA